VNPTHGQLCLGDTAFYPQGVGKGVLAKVR